MLGKKGPLLARRKKSQANMLRKMTEEELRVMGYKNKPSRDDLLSLRRSSLPKISNKSTEHCDVTELPQQSYDGQSSYSSMYLKKNGGNSECEYIQQSYEGQHNVSNCFKKNLQDTKCTAAAKFQASPELAMRLQETIQQNIAKKMAEYYSSPHPLLTYEDDDDDEKALGEINRFESDSDITAEGRD